MTTHHDDYSAPLLVRNLRYLRDELAEVERKIPEARRRYFALVEQKLAIKSAIDDNLRYLYEKGDDVN